MLLNPSFEVLEELVEQGNLKNLSPENQYAKLLKSFAEKNWIELEKETRSLWAKSSSDQERVFILQWIVAAQEIVGDYKSRDTWLESWRNIQKWAVDPYCRYHKFYQEGLTHYFHSRFREAGNLFELAYNCAMTSGYERGKMRSLFHRGLVAVWIDETPQAKHFFTRAADVATKLLATTYLQRIQNRLDLLAGSTSSDEQSLSYLRQQIEIHLLSKKFSEARQWLALAEAKRRKLGYNKDKEALYIYRHLILSLRYPERQTKSLQRIMDPAQKLYALELKQQIDPTQLTLEESTELKILQEVFGINGVIRVSDHSSAANNIEICGKNIQDIPVDLRSLMNALLDTSTELEKENLCEQVWKISYDPIDHDGKIYKLVHKARKYFGLDDLILNVRGAYRLNPAYKPRKVI